MYKFKRAMLMTLAIGFVGGGDHSQHHDRHPSQSKVRRFSTLTQKKHQVFHPK